MIYPAILSFLTFFLFNFACAQSGNREQGNSRFKLEITVRQPYLAKLLQLQREYEDAYGIDSTSKGLSPDSSTGTGNFGAKAYSFLFPNKPLNWTNDFEFLLTRSQRLILDSLITKYEKETTIEIAIVTIDSTWTTKAGFDSLVLAIHNAWGVGKKDKNNGVVIGVSAGLHLIRINNGYGIEPKLSDVETEKIINSTIIPEFRRLNYFEGIKRGLMAIMSTVR